MSSLLSEIEVMDNTLPYVSNTTSTNKDKPNQNDENSNDSKIKIFAPTIEEVDEDPESLRTLRGQGRYFGVFDDDKDGIKEAVPKCSNCSQRGHLKKNCPHVICTYCGAMDDHYSKHCPKAIKCANCNENGHYRSQCPHKWKRVYCTLCNSKKHSRERCPSIWRVYLIKDQNKKNNRSSSMKKVPFDRIFCYNCGSQGHFGDDCDKRRSSRVPNDDGSAFSGDNLPSKLKRSYYTYINEMKRGNNNHFDFSDYEIDESYYNNDSGSKRNNKKRKRSNRDKDLNVNRNNRYNNNNNNSDSNNTNSRSHPLDFPRSNRYNSNSVLNNMQNSRYNGNNINNSNISNGRNYKPANYKSYNSFKPFRSGTIRR